MSHRRGKGFKFRTAVKIKKLPWQTTRNDLLISINAPSAKDAGIVARNWSTHARKPEQTRWSVAWAAKPLTKQFLVMFIINTTIITPYHSHCHHHHRQHHHHHHHKHQTIHHYHPHQHPVNGHHHQQHQHQHEHSHQNKEVSSLIIIKRITITNPHHQQHHQHYQMLSVRLMNVIMNLGWERLRVLDGVGEVDIDDYEWWWRWWWLGWRLKVVTMATFGKFGRDLFSCCTGLSTYGLFWFKQNK